MVFDNKRNQILEKKFTLHITFFGLIDSPKKIKDNNYDYFMIFLCILHFH